MKDAKGHGSAARQTGVDAATTKSPIDDRAERMAKAYLADDEDGARKIMNEAPLKQFEYVVLTDKFRKLVGK